MSYIRIAHKSSFVFYCLEVCITFYQRFCYDMVKTKSIASINNNICLIATCHFYTPRRQ